MKPIIIAHRGASYLSKHENTLEAFGLAIEMGADYVEFDIRKTSDNELIIYHDSKINNIDIDTLSYREVSYIAKQHDFQIPKLIEVLEFCKGKIKLDIELKESGYEKRVVDLVSGIIDYKDFIIKSFEDKSVAIIKNYDSHIKVGLLLGKKHHSIDGYMEDLFPSRRLDLCKADFVSPNYKLLNPILIRQLRKNNIPIYPWTINSPNKLNRLFRLKVDGIITDRPDVALFLRNKYSKGK